MKWPKLPPKVWQTLTGMGVILVGSGVSLLPAVGQFAGPAIISGGVYIMTQGIIDKRARAKAGGDPWAKERAVINKLIKPKGGQDG